MVGTGYVGLVTGVCFANTGNDVVCLDVDPDKIEKLKKDICPIYEPGLTELMVKNREAGRLVYTLDKAEAYRDADMVFICVGTPSDERGHTDMKYVHSAADDIADVIKELGPDQKPKIVVMKSTVPVGTTLAVKERIRARVGPDIPFSVADNPEFLKEGDAINDFQKPDRIVVGVEEGDEHTAEAFRDLYDPFVRNGHPIYIMDVPSAEMVKYASNNFLATKISFINEMANLCEAYGANINKVREGMCSDKRIGGHFLYPGLGYGGSCFPKDTLACIMMGEKSGVKTDVSRAVHETNQRQRDLFFKKILGHFGGEAGLTGKKLAFWGLAFKPRTDDIREAPALTIARKALGYGCTVTGFDPVAMENVKKEAPTIELVGDTYDEASAAAQAFTKERGSAFVHPYDDLVTMGGQGTIADEVVVAGVEPFDAAYLQIGGGGMAAAVGAWLKKFMPGIRIVGVEGAGQASMKAAVAQGGPVTLEQLDIFCDGTAVRRAGDLTYELCRDVIDEFITVSNEEVCSAIRLFWEARRRIVEPAGAMGLAGMLQQRDELKGKRVLGVMCGANMDFAQLAVIAAEAGTGGEVRKHIRFEIGERPGAMLDLIDHALSGCNIVDFQYGKTNDALGHPVIGFDAPPDVIQRVHEHCQRAGIAYQDITAHEDVDFRIVNYDPKLFRQPLMIQYFFPERPGALHEFLQRVSDLANLCYFNYLYTGERIGRALVGLEFASDSDRAALLDRLKTDPLLRHSHRELSPEALSRML